MVSSISKYFNEQIRYFHSICIRNFSYLFPTTHFINRFYLIQSNIYLFISYKKSSVSESRKSGSMDLSSPSKAYWANAASHPSLIFDFFRRTRSPLCWKFIWMIVPALRLKSLITVSGTLRPNEVPISMTVARATASKNISAR